jgi:exonuclease III
MRLISWNILAGGVERANAIVGAIQSHDADVLVLTEYRQSSRPVFVRRFEELGFSHHMDSDPRAGFNGVAIFSRKPFVALPCPFDAPPLSERWLEVQFDEARLRLIGAYGPLKKAGDAIVQSFWETLIDSISARRGHPYLLVGDLNTGQAGVDAKDPRFFCSQHFTQLPAVGWEDAWRALNGDLTGYSWFSRRDGRDLNGFRIDHAFVTAAARPAVVACQYSDAERLAGTSDHAVLLVDLDLTRVGELPAGLPDARVLDQPTVVVGERISPLKVSASVVAQATRSYASKGSQRWLQIAVNRAPELLNTELRQSLHLPERAEITWLSPLQAEGFVEYRDQAWVDRLGVQLAKKSLRDFWPFGGPVWDGLARISSGQVLLVEAKGHIPELISSPTRAKSEATRDKIRQSLRDVQQDLTRGSVDWNGVFFQYANRLAHLHFLREQNGIDAHLVNVYFVNATDVAGPSSREEWMGALRLVESILGVGSHRLSRYMHKVFVDVSGLRPFEPDAGVTAPLAGPASLGNIPSTGAAQPVS